MTPRIFMRSNRIFTYRFRHIGRRLGLHRLVFQRDPWSLMSLFLSAAGSGLWRIWTSCDGFIRFLCATTASRCGWIGEWRKQTKDNWSDLVNICFCLLRGGIVSWYFIDLYAWWACFPFPPVTLIIFSFSWGYSLTQTVDKLPRVCAARLRFPYFYHARTHFHNWCALTVTTHFHNNYYAVAISTTLSQ